MTQRKRRADWFHRYLANPITVRLPTQVVLETTARTGSAAPHTGRRQDHQPAVLDSRRRRRGGRRCAKHQGPQCGWIRIKGCWRRGTAVLLPDDDAALRLTQLPRFNSAMVRALGTKPLTVRVDLRVEAMKTVYHQPKRRSQPLKTLVDGDVRATGLSGMRLPVQTAPIIRSSANAIRRSAAQLRECSPLNCYQSSP